MLYIGGEVRQELPYPIGSSSHHMMWEIGRCLKHLMRRYGLRSAMSGYGACEVTLSHGKNIDTCGVNHSGLKPHFSPWIKEKNRSFKGLLWGTEI